jgi:hypothetical protein
MLAVIKTGKVKDAEPDACQVGLVACGMDSRSQFL